MCRRALAGRFIPPVAETDASPYQVAFGDFGARAVIERVFVFRPPRTVG
jgi:hypothetical protein